VIGLDWGKNTYNVSNTLYSLCLTGDFVTQSASSHLKVRVFRPITAVYLLMIIKARHFANGSTNDIDSLKVVDPFHFSSRYQCE